MYTNASKPVKILKLISGIVFAVLFVFSCVWQFKLYYNQGVSSSGVQILTIILLFAALMCFLPQKRREDSTLETSSAKPIGKRTIFAAIFVLVAVPLTIFAGLKLPNGKSYYFISLLIIAETILPFLISFESKKPKAREVVMISVLCAVAVASRTAFFYLPQFKPVIAVVIIAGVCFGGESGFLVGVVSGFVSNFFFGQGPWTPWQMAAFGAIGLVAGLLCDKGVLKKRRLPLCIFGAISTFAIFGGITNYGSLILWQPDYTKEQLISTYLMGAPFDGVHAISTAFFLWFAGEPIIEKIDRVKIKYGI